MSHRALVVVETANLMSYLLCIHRESEVMTSIAELNEPIIDFKAKNPTVSPGTKQRRLLDTCSHDRPIVRGRLCTGRPGENAN